MESSPFRVIPLLSISLPCRGNIFFRYRERARRRLVLEAEFEKKTGLWLWFYYVYMYYNVFHFNICLYKSNFLTLETIVDSWELLG